ncbi:MAG TPA: hypothetical protein VM532_08245 [Burkholderiales bacterium]|nr:hypothetical protein [Burkholderiales bacterium]
MEYLQPYLNINGFLPSAVLTFLMYVALHRFRSSMVSLAFVTLPGTIAHEAAHYVVGFLLLGKPQGFNVLPKRQGNSLILGSVSFTGINMLNGAFVAMAPLLLLPLAWLSMIHFAIPFWTKGVIPFWILSVFLTANLLFAAIPSSQDFKVGAPSLMLYGSMCGGWLLASFVWHG